MYQPVGIGHNISERNRTVQEPGCMNLLSNAFSAGSENEKALCIIHKTLPFIVAFFLGFQSRKRDSNSRPTAGDGCSPKALRSTMVHPSKYAMPTMGWAGLSAGQQETASSSHRCHTTCWAGKPDR